MRVRFTTMLLMLALALAPVAARPRTAPGREPCQLTDEDEREAKALAVRFMKRLLEAGAFGLQAGALLIRTRIYPYEMALTRTNGKLEMLVAYPDFDGD